MIMFFHRITHIIFNSVCMRMYLGEQSQISLKITFEKCWKTI